MAINNLAKNIKWEKNSLFNKQCWNTGYVIWKIFFFKPYHQFSSVQSLSRVWLFATPWTAAPQASLSITNSQSLPKLKSIESVMPSSHLIFCHLLLFLSSIFPSIRVFSNESTLCIRWPSIGVSASTSVLPVNTQDWSPLGWTGWISFSPRDSQESSPTPWLNIH